jgi:inner membrane protein
MDNVCHTLVGAAFGRAGLARRSRYGSAALMVAANVPDVDVLVFATGLPSVAFRRGWTHGVLAQLLLPLLVTAAFVALDRLRPVAGDRTAASAGDRPRRVRPGWLLAMSYLGVYSHVGLDYLNNYGVRLLTPFDWRWFYGDAVFIIDPWLWAALGLGVWLARRQRRTKPARLALAVAVAYVLVMLAVAQASRRQVADEWARQAGRPAAALMVGPVPVVPWTREVIIDVGDEYRTGRFNVLSSRLRLDRDSVRKNDGLDGVATARHVDAVGAFLVWSRFPFWRVVDGPDGRDVSVGDMRFRNRVVGGFGARATFPPSVGGPQDSSSSGQAAPTAR